MTSFTRSKLQGIRQRLINTYGASVIGMKLQIRWHEHFGCHMPVFEASLRRAVERGLTGFDPTGDYKTSANWHFRNELTWKQRLQLERDARVFRSEDFIMLRRQAG